MGDLPNTPTQQTNTTDKQKPFKRGVNSSEKQKTYQQKNADGFLCVLKKKTCCCPTKKEKPPHRVKFVFNFSVRCQIDGMTAGVWPLALCVTAARPPK